jgi:hypothetical protein
MIPYGLQGSMQKVCGELAHPVQSVPTVTQALPAPQSGSRAQASESGQKAVVSRPQKRAPPVVT